MSSSFWEQAKTWLHRGFWQYRQSTCTYVVTCSLEKTWLYQNSYHFIRHVLYRQKTISQLTTYIKFYFTSCAVAFSTWVPPQCAHVESCGGALLDIKTTLLTMLWPLEKPSCVFQNLACHWWLHKESLHFGRMHSRLIKTANILFCVRRGRPSKWYS